MTCDKLQNQELKKVEMFRIPRQLTEESEEIQFCNESVTLFSLCGNWHKLALESEGELKQFF